MDIGLVLLIIGCIYLATKTGIGFLGLLASVGFIVLAFQHSDEPLILIAGLGSAMFMFYWTFFGGEDK